MKAMGPFLADLVEQVRVVDLKSSRTLRAIPQLASYIRKQRPAVLISALDHVNGAAIAAGWLSRTGTPIVTAVHTSRSTPAQQRLRTQRQAGRLVSQLLLPPGESRRLRFSRSGGGYDSHRAGGTAADTRHI